MFFFFPFSFDFFCHILYKGKRLGIQQSLTWQTEQKGEEKKAWHTKKMKGTKLELTWNLNWSLPTQIQDHEILSRRTRPYSVREHTEPG